MPDASPAERIAASLAYINWTVLAALAVGAFGAVVLARLRTDATRGFLAFTGLCAAGFGLLAILSDLALPRALGGPIEPDPAFDLPRRIALGACTVLSLAYAVAVARGRRAPAIGLGGLAAGLVALGAAALGWGGGLPGAGPLFVQLVVLAAATGGVFAAMILGHWYLVTPKLSERPLVLFARALLWIVGLQVLLFLAWTTTGTGPGGADGPFAALVGPWALFVWLRLLVGLVFPLVVVWMALQTARSRSMESATGLLYISVGTIAAGTILAAGLYFGAGLLV
ncbi:MAG TPA: hypothetical protein VNJ28_02875 [Candidatus Limnocylindrales bacterium]|nr:hypothetical protein [Candidatus Limnocylindrales bacterium]